MLAAGGETWLAGIGASAAPLCWVMVFLPEGHRGLLIKFVCSVPVVSGWKDRVSRLCQLTRKDGARSMVLVLCCTAVFHIQLGLPARPVCVPMLLVNPELYPAWPTQPAEASLPLLSSAPRAFFGSDFPWCLTALWLLPSPVNSLRLLHRGTQAKCSLKSSLSLRIGESGIATHAAMHAWELTLAVSIILVWAVMHLGHLKGWYTPGIRPDGPCRWGRIMQ